jgi:hypothetical protein
MCSPVAFAQRVSSDYGASRSYWITQHRSPDEPSVARMRGRWRHPGAVPHVVEFIIGRAFARPVGSCGLQASSPRWQKVGGRFRHMRLLWRRQGGPRKACCGPQNCFAAAATALLMMSRRSGESILISSSRLMMEPASSRTAGIRVDFSTTS